MSPETNKSAQKAAEKADDTNGFGLHIPFAKYLGLHLTEQNAERAQIRVERRPELLNSWGAVTGGVIMAVMDLAMGSAVRGRIGANVSVATVDISMAFMNPARGAFTVEGRVLEGGRSTWFCEAQALADDGTLIAKGIGTLKPVPGKK